MSNVNIGVWTQGIGNEVTTGPWLAIKRMLLAMHDMESNISDDIVCLHFEKSNDEIYDLYDDITIERSDISTNSDILTEGYGISLVLEKSIPASIRDGLYFGNPSPKYNKCAWVHGISSFNTQYAYGNQLDPDNITDKIHAKKERMIQRLLAPRYDNIVANSRYTKDVLVNSMNVPEKRIEVIRYGVNHAVFREYPDSETKPVIDSLNIKTPAILYVANYDPRKGPMTVVRAFNSLRKRGYDYHLIIVGDRYENSPVLEYAKESGIKDSMTFTGYLDEETVAKLYNISELFVFPTFHETFGMPILEAMAAGCPVVSSDCTVIPEVAGDAAELVSNPGDADELTNTIAKILDSKELQKEYISRGKHRSKDFRWSNCAERFERFFNKVTSR